MFGSSIIMTIPPSKQTICSLHPSLIKAEDRENRLPHSLKAQKSTPPHMNYILKAQNDMKTPYKYFYDKIKCGKICKIVIHLSGPFNVYMSEEKIIKRGKS